MASLVQPERRHESGSQSPGTLSSHLACACVLQAVCVADSAPSVPSADCRVFSCSRCQRVNRADARFCDWCSCKVTACTGSWWELPSCISPTPLISSGQLRWHTEQCDALWEVSSATCVIAAPASGGLRHMLALWRAWRSRRPFLCFLWHLCGGAGSSHIL